MKYKIKFPNRSIEKEFERTLLNIPHKVTQEKIMQEIEKLANNPRPYGEKKFKKIKPPVEVYSLTAEYRIRIGDYRVLYDINDNKKIVWILVLRKKSERTYR